jgi:hypothetical protein
VTLVIAVAVAGVKVVALVKNVPGVEVTLVTTGVVTVEPFKNDTVCKGPTVPGLVGLVNCIVPLF